MKRSLEIYNFGPIKEVKMDFARFNVIIGPQSAGKSCILKIACHCAWAEKRLMVSRDVTLFQKDNFFFTQLLSFHKLEGYDSSPDLKIVYRTTFLTITYTHRDRQFACRFTSQRRLYKRSKLSYIPAERNVVSTIPNWMELSYADTNTRSFMSDWVEARKGYTDKHLPILDLGAEYFYDKTSQTDMVACEGVEKPLPMSNVSSGLQSVIPLALYIHYLTGDVFADKAASVARQRDNEALMYSLYDDFYKNGIPAVHPKCEANIGGKFLSFASASDRDAFLKRYNNLSFQS